MEHTYNKIKNSRVTSDEGIVCRNGRHKNNCLLKKKKVELLNKNFYTFVFI